MKKIIMIFHKLYPKDMRDLAIGGEEDCGMSTYTQWVGGGEGARKKVSDYIHVCFCCS